MSKDLGAPLRQALPAELRVIYDLRARSFDHACRSTHSAEELRTLMWGYSPVELSAAIAAGEIHVHEREGRIAGYVWLEGARGKELVVSPEFDGLGVGALLLSVGLRILLERSPGEVEIAATRNAVKFYERVGFVAMGAIEVAHRETGGAISLVEMRITRERAEAAARILPM